MTRRGIVLAALVLGAGLAQAESVWVGGVVAGEDSDSAYLARSAPLPGSSLRAGWSYAAALAAVRYHYDREQQQIDARAAGARLGMTHRWEWGSGSFALGAGVNLRRTRLTPDDSANASRGTKLRQDLELQWQSAPEQPWLSSVYGDYTLVAKAYYAKAFVGHRLNGGVAIGPEAWAVGDPQYNATGFGIGLREWRIGGTDLHLRLGAQRQAGDHSVVVSIEFVRYVER